MTLAFQGKYRIQADLVCVTGLHIGGTQEEREIGGLDSPVIKDPVSGEPYIPGSSLKGKIRSLLEWQTGRVSELLQSDDRYIDKGTPCGCGACDVCCIFGSPAKEGAQPTRLIVRDAFLHENSRADLEEALGRGIYTEVKTENSIHRITSRANPRPMERVPPGARFVAELLMDVYEEDDHARLRTLLSGMALLEDSALGGGGSRGSGRVRFENLRITYRPIDYYTAQAEEKGPLNGKATTVREALTTVESWRQR